MSETYSDIIEEIKGLDNEYDYRVRVHYPDYVRPGKDTSNFADVLVHLCERVQEAVAGDPSEWYVLDANNERVYIGDSVRRNNGTHDDIERVQGFICKGATTVFASGGSCSNNSIVKVIPDTREKIIDDLAKELNQGHGLFTADFVKEIAEQFVDRAMKLPEVDA